MKENVSCTCTTPRTTPRWGVVIAVAALAVLAGFAAPATWAQIDPGVCDDGNPCTIDVADPNVIDGGCRHTQKNCNDDNICTTDSCNPTTGQCVNTPTGGGDCGGGSCDDGDPCTIDVADPNVIDGGCRHTPKDCNDDNACTTDSCDESTGQCVNTPTGGGGGDTGCTCDDGDPCTIDSGTPGGDGGCQHTPKNCNDDNACTADSCNTETGQCVNTPTGGGDCGGSCDDGDPCTVDVADPNVIDGGCRHTPKNCNDSDPCTSDSCNPTTGQCVNTPTGGGGGDTGCTCDDGDPCTIDTGTPGGDGGCQHTPKDCDDDNPCTVDSCEGGTCVNEPVGGGGGDAGCDLAICRTPGFYGTHAGTEKTGSVNITQALITAAGGSLSICGETISTTIVNDDASAVEGICVPVQGAQQLQLARQLIAAALNCIISDGDESCASTPLYASIFATCNATCANPASSTTALANCINDIDCLNNGGLKNGFCQTGTCLSGLPCGPKNACADGSTCKALDGNCHSELLINGDLGLSFTKEGPAGSSKACNNANGTGCVVVGVNQSKCKY